MNQTIVKIQKWNNFRQRKSLLVSAYFEAKRKSNGVQLLLKIMKLKYQIYALKSKFEQNKHFHHVKKTTIFACLKCCINCRRRFKRHGGMAKIMRFKIRSCVQFLTVCGMKHNNELASKRIIARFMDTCYHTV